MSVMFNHVRLFTFMLSFAVVLPVVKKNIAWVPA